MPEASDPSVGLLFTVQSEAGGQLAASFESSRFQCGGQLPEDLGRELWFDPWPVNFKMLPMDHSPGFLKVVDEAKPRVKETTLEEAKALLAAEPGAVLVDVREDGEWSLGRVENAVHLGKGILERDIESVFPEKNKLLIMYCGGGYRSILTADAAQKIGYTRVLSLRGGYKALASAGWKIVK